MSTSDNRVTTTYSETGARHYEDPTNRDFLYGALTTEFLSGIRLTSDDRTTVDVGCGTGFVFDVLEPQIRSLGLSGLGIDPAAGMLEIARSKHQGAERLSFASGDFESIPAPDRSVDRILSCLALHWAPSLDAALAEMRRVLAPSGRIDILMIGRADGAEFKKAVLRAMQNHLTFAEIMKAAALAKRYTATQAQERFESVFGSGISVTPVTRIVHGTFEAHMRWWKSRSSQIIADIDDTGAFMNDLRAELEKTSGPEGIPFDLECLTIRKDR